MHHRLVCPQPVVGKHQQRRFGAGNDEQTVGDQRKYDVVEQTRREVAQNSGTAEADLHHNHDGGEAEEHGAKSLDTGPEAGCQYRACSDPQDHRRGIEDAEVQTTFGQQTDEDRDGVQRHSYGCRPAVGLAAGGLHGATRGQKCRGEVENDRQTAARGTHPSHGASIRESAAAPLRDSIARMFDNLTSRLSKVVRDLRGVGRLTEDNINDSLREVRLALLEADVALPVVKDFISDVRERALGADVAQHLTPGQAFIKIVNASLIHLMGDHNEGLDLGVEPPAVVLMAGLQGSGKTTTVAKLARLLRERDGRKVAVVSCDVYRPAAIKQLETLAGQVEVHFIASRGDEDPREIAARALTEARRMLADVLLVDTAGRLAIDAELMDEIRDLHALLKPVETLFVVDAMTGQDAVKTARAFDEALAITGVVLTKADGDARGGAALSVRQVTGKPLKFIGTGEKPDALEAFHPDRMASRILGMGDVLSLIEEVEQKVDREQAQKVAEKLRKGKGFDLEDFRDQMKQMQKMGGIAGMISKLPGVGALPTEAMNQVNDREVTKILAIIDSMTPGERRFPAIVKTSRKRRIAAGSGTEIADVNKLLKQFNQMQKMMKKLSKKGGLKNMMRGLSGRMPPGMRFPQ